MTKLQLLHRALNERLMAAVEQIMEMVGGTVLEYEEETIRVRKENEVLRRRLRWMEGANPADWPGLSEPVSLFIPDQSNPALQEGCAVSLEHDQESKPFVIKTEPADIADDPSFITPLPPGTDPGSASAGAGVGVDSVNLDSTTSYMAPLDSDPTLSTAVRPWRGKNKKQKSSFACPDCGKVFGREQTLMFHMRVHSAEKPYAYRRRKACFYVESKRKVRGFTKLAKESVDDTSDGSEQANRSSASSESHVLPRSAAPVKEQEPAGLSAAESDQTNRDKDPKNSTVKPVPLRRRGGKAKMSRCSQCSRVFARPCQLAMHMKTHSMRKPLANLPNKEPSGRDEKRKQSMRNIDAEVDEGGGQSVFPCPDCDKVFARSCWLTFHMKTHVHEKASLRKRLQTDMPVQTEGLYSIMLVKVEFHGLKKFIKLQNGFTFSDFITEVQSRFDVRTGSDLRIYDESQTEIEQDLLQELLETNPESTIIIKDLNEDFLTNGTASFCADAASLMIRSSSDLNVTPERHAKRPKTAEEVNEYEATSAKEMVLGALKEKPRGEDVLEEYKATNSLSNEIRRILVNILVGHMTERHGRIPTREQREHYALGIVTLFPSLKDPFSKKGYEHFYDAESGSGYLAWRLKTVQRNTTRRSEKKNESNVPQGGPNLRRTGSVEKQLDGNALREAISLLSHTTVEATVFEKMRETFQHRQDLVHNAETTTDVLKTFPRFLDTKGLVNQDFILLLNAETSTKLLKRWNTTIKNKIIQEARCLTPTPVVLHLLMSAEKNLKNAIDSTWDSDLATLLLLIHLLPPTAGRKMATKISASDAADRLVVFHKTCSGIKEHVEQRQSRHPYLLAVGENRGKIDNYYIALDKKLIPCQAFGSLGAFDELFKVHFVFNISYNDALVNFYTFVQTTVYKIDIGNTKESPRVKELRAKLLNNT